MIHDIEPMLAESTPALPAGPEWLHEQKYDGVRVLAYVGETVALRTRKGHDKARQFPELADALRALRARVGQDLVLDGEIVASASDGFTGFQLLQRRIGVEQPFRIRVLTKAIPAQLVLFDMLALGQLPIMNRPLAERREALAFVLNDPPPNIRLGIQSADGSALLARAQAENWEGIVSKRRTSRYVPGQRSPEWRKLKTVRRQEFVVGGYTESESDSRDFRALVVGYFADGRLVYAGRVGSGFSERDLSALARRLQSLECADCPFSDPPELDEPTRWVRPAMVVEVRFQDWTDTDRLRSPVYIAAREDKPPHLVVRET